MFILFFSTVAAVKLEPGVEPTKWRLIAVSQAARLRKNIIVLETNQNYLLGRSRNSDIHISSPFCSKVHCELIVRDMEVILKDEVRVFVRVQHIDEFRGYVFDR